MWARLPGHCVVQAEELKQAPTGSQPLAWSGTEVWELLSAQQQGDCWFVAQPRIVQVLTDVPGPMPFLSVRSIHSHPPEFQQLLALVFLQPVGQRELIRAHRPAAAGSGQSQPVLRAPIG